MAWEEKAVELGLDEMCLQALRGVSSERAHQIVRDAEAKAGEIRNLSAFVNKAARQTTDESETLRRALEVDIWKDLLDETAKAEVMMADPSRALTVLADVRALGESVRNISSYVCGTLRKRRAEGKFVAAAAGPSSWFPPAGVAAQAMAAKGMSPPVMGSKGAGGCGWTGGGSTVGPWQATASRSVSSFSPSGAMHSRIGGLSQAMGGLRGSQAMGGMRGSQAATADVPGKVRPTQAPVQAVQRGHSVGQSQTFWGSPPAAPGMTGPMPTFRLMPSAMPMMGPPREVSQSEKLEIDLAIAELAPDLDERAVDRVYQLGSADEARKALEVLVNMGEGVRNKSAFINGIVAKRLQNMPSRDNSEEVQDQEEKREEFQIMLDTFEDLDDQARQVMMEVETKLGPAEGIRLLTELQNKKDQGDLRNVSGFASSMARTRLSGGGGVQSYENDQAAEFSRMMRQWGEDLDERARKVLQELQQRMGPAAALTVLKELEMKVEKEEVRNISSFVFSMVRQRLQAAPQVPPTTFPVSRGPMMSGRVPPTSSIKPTVAAGPLATLPWLQEQLEAYDLKGRLDESVLQIMMTTQQDRITEILQDMAEREEPVRNPSAFIQKSLKDHPNLRKRPAPSEAYDWPPYKRQQMDLGSDDPLLKYDDLLEKMDEVAVTRLRGHPDRGRVRDILAEMAAKIDDIRNPSAFVVRALNDPSKGQSLGPMY